MSTVWPLIWSVESNVNIDYTTPRANRQITTIPKHLDLAITVDMLDVVNLTVSAVAEPDFEILHYPGITIETTTVDLGGGGGGGDDSSPMTYSTVVENDMPPRPSGVSLRVVDSNINESGFDRLSDIITISGNTLRLRGEDFKFLFPYEHISYIKNGTTYRRENVFPYQINEDDYDVIFAAEANRYTTKSVWIKVQAESSSSYNPELTLSFSVTNNLTYWHDTYLDDMFQKSAKFVDVLAIEQEEVQRMSEITEEPVFDLNDDYVETTPDMFNEDENGRIVDVPSSSIIASGTDIDEALYDGEYIKTDIVHNQSVLESVDSVASLNDKVDILIAQKDEATVLGLSRHKMDDLIKALSAFKSGGFDSPLSIVREVYGSIISEGKMVPALKECIERTQKSQYVSVTRILTEISSDPKVSTRLINEFNGIRRELELRNQDNAVASLTNIINQINADSEFLDDLERIVTHFGDRNIDTGVDELSRLLDEGIPTPPSTPVISLNDEVPEKPPANARMVSKDDLNTWFDTHFKKD